VQKMWKMILQWWMSLRWCRYQLCGDWGISVENKN
jgi:hypothetical protein